MSQSHPVSCASVVVSVYENDRWIGQQLRSLLDQWRADVDLIIIDDGSSDRSLHVALDVIATRADVSCVVVRNDRHSGLAVLKQILQLSKSDIIIQADSDDVTLPGAHDATSSVSNEPSLSETSNKLWCIDGRSNVHAVASVNGVATNTATSKLITANHLAICKDAFVIVGKRIQPTVELQCAPETRD